MTLRLGSFWTKVSYSSRTDGPASAPPDSSRPANCSSAAPSAAKHSMRSTKALNTFLHIFRFRILLPGNFKGVLACFRPCSVAWRSESDPWHSGVATSLECVRMPVCTLRFLSTARNLKRNREALLSWLMETVNALRNMALVFSRLAWYLARQENTR